MIPAHPLVLGVHMVRRYGQFRLFQASWNTTLWILTIHTSVPLSTFFMDLLFTNDCGILNQGLCFFTAGAFENLLSQLFAVHSPFIANHGGSFLEETQATDGGVPSCCIGDVFGKEIIGMSQGLSCFSAAAMSGTCDPVCLCQSFSTLANIFVAAVHVFAQDDMHFVVTDASHRCCCASTVEWAH